MTTATDHERTVENWRAQRYAALRRPIGWLTLAGLDWLRPGANRVGSGADNDVVLAAGPATAGTITVTNGRPVADGAFLYEGRPAREVALTTDANGEPTMLELGPLRFCVIERGGRLAVRTWDTESVTLRRFDGIDHWPVDPAWRLTGRFEPTPGRTLRVPDVIGIIEDEASPGEVVFEAARGTHRLQALEGGPNGELWLVFGDATNGEDTYGGGRFLYTPSPDADGRVEVDFNRAYNPPCVFTRYATCPLPWPENRLPVRVEAGERSYVTDAH